MTDHLWKLAVKLHKWTEIDQCPQLFALCILVSYPQVLLSYGPYKVQAANFDWCNWHACEYARRRGDALPNCYWASPLLQSFCAVRGWGAQQQFGSASLTCRPYSQLSCKSVYHRRHQWLLVGSPVFCPGAPLGGLLRTSINVPLTVLMFPQPLSYLLQVNVGVVCNSYLIISIIIPSN